jgi:thiamine biosynthesis lipoprotein
MGSPCQCILYGQDSDHLSVIMQQVLVELQSLEQQFSRYQPHSWLSQVNQAAGTGQPTLQTPMSLAWVTYADQAFKQSQGLFDATAGVLRQAWNFRSDQLPDPAQIDTLLPLIGWDKVQWNQHSIYLPLRGMQLDFGGFGKEYAADYAAARFRAQGIVHGLVDFGGDLAVVGLHPDQQPWKVGVRDPLQAGRAICQLTLSQGGLATSGMYERCIRTETKCYGHILQPSTGWPVEASWASVTVLAPQCLVAGTLTTVALLHAAIDAQRYLDETGLAYVRIDLEGNIHTQGLSLN